MKQKSNFLCKFAKICSFKTLQVVKGEITVLRQFEGIKQTNDSRWNLLKCAVSISLHFDLAKRIVPGEFEDMNQKSVRFSFKFA